MQLINKASYKIFKFQINFKIKTIKKKSRIFKIFKVKPIFQINNKTQSKIRILIPKLILIGYLYHHMREAYY